MIYIADRQTKSTDRGDGSEGVGINQRPTQEASASCEAPEAGGAPNYVKSLNPKQGAPLNGAFTCNAAQQGNYAGRAAKKPNAGYATNPAWQGAVVTIDDLNEAKERRLIGANDDKLLIASFGPFNPDAKPVVLVHGINGSPEDFKDLAARLHQQGRQVFIAFYDDRGARTHKSGEQLAGALQGLRAEHYQVGAPLDIIAHSMGGIVTRVALNTLQTGGVGEVEGMANARAGFGPIRVRTVDTPWDGFPHEPGFMAFLRPVVQFFLWLFGWSGAYDMRANSEMFNTLYKPTLQGVDMQNHAAVQAGEQDSIRALPDLDLDERRAIAAYILGGPLPEGKRARNMALALRQDARYATLQQAMRRESTQATQADDLVHVYERVMPRFIGGHAGVLKDAPGRQDVVDHIVEELG